MDSSKHPRKSKPRPIAHLLGDGWRRRRRSQLSCARCRAGQHQRRSSSFAGLSCIDPAFFLGKSLVVVAQRQTLYHWRLNGRDWCHGLGINWTSSLESCDGVANLPRLGLYVTVATWCILCLSCYIRPARTCNQHVVNSAPRSLVAEREIPSQWA